MSQTQILETGDGKMNLFEVKPQGTPKGAVIVIQEAFGVNDHIKDIVRRFAKEGYLSVAPSVFHRSGGDPIIEYSNMAGVMPHIMGLKAETIEADVGATIDYLASIGIPASRVAIIGFCMGGTIALAAGKRWALGAAITCYGGGITAARFGFPTLLELAPDLQTPWLGMYGDADQSIPFTEVELLRKAAATAKVPTEVVRYADAEHGFHCDARPGSYHEASAKDGWARILAWLGTNIKAG